MPIDENTRAGKVRRGAFNVGPVTACTLLELWATGKISITVVELRQLVKIISEFLEELEEVRSHEVRSKRTE